MDSASLLQMRAISKRYGGVTALDQVDFACASGSIHAVLGENGAGKSTLIKAIAGVVQPDTGEMTMGGRPVVFHSPIDAAQHGIVCVFQELSLIPDLSVADNILLTNAPNRWGFVDRKAQRARAEALLERVGCADIHPLELVRNLPLSRRQMVEIAKALGREPKLLILDEATSALTVADVDKVYAILHRLREQGLAILYISHRMNEIKELADTCSVFRNGRHVETFATGTRSDEQVVQLMIGRDLAKTYPPKPALPADAPVSLEARGLQWGDRLNDISLTIRKGEIVGLGGLDGQGQRELMLALFGVLRGVGGQLSVHGQPVTHMSPGRAKSPALGLALIPEDRKTEGLILPMAIAENLSMAALSRLSAAGWVNRTAEGVGVAGAIAKLRIKIGATSDAVATLSGGNQQKVVIGKWLMTNARVILLNDPTRGIDVGTKQEIYVLLRELAAEGVAVLLYSTDYEELIGLCDRVLIMYGGAITRVLEGEHITETNIVAAALNLAAGDKLAA